MHRTTNSSQNIINRSENVIVKDKIYVASDTDLVVVVAARFALNEYLKCSAYICQPNRAFRECVRMAFYANGKIDRHIPKILGQIEAISSHEIEIRTDITSFDKERLRALLRNIDSERRKELEKASWKIVFLSPPSSPDTLVLPHEIVNNLISGSGRGIAFTRGQRYVSLSHLQKGPKTTSELR